MTSSWDVAFSSAIRKVTLDRNDISEELYIMHRRQDHILQFLHVAVALKNQEAVLKTRKWIRVKIWDETSELAKKNNIEL
jgi:hypothetical protein